MGEENPEDRAIRSYLLGEMSEEERAVFQQRIFEDDEVFLRVLAAEDDMADALAKGELAENEAVRVRQFFEESSQTGRLGFAHALSHADDQPARSPARWIWRSLPVAACILLGVAALWLDVRNRELRMQIAQVRPAAQISGAIFSARIPAGTLRGSETPLTLQIPPDAKAIELRLEVRSPGNYAQYRVDVARASGAVIQSLTIPAPLPVELSVLLSRAAVPAGSYEVALSGLRGDQATPIDYYYFVLR
jgi:hypothetical protein